MLFVNSARTRIRPVVAAFTALCGLATAAGSVLTWLRARGARPRIGMAHTSLRQMLVYSFANVAPFWKSAGLAVLVLGVLIVIGALAGLRTLTMAVAVLALGAAGMWIGLIVHHYNTPNLPNAHYLNPASLPWSDLRQGAWLTITGAAGALLSAPWLRQRHEHATYQATQS
jgi:hypothetical protein